MWLSPCRTVGFLAQWLVFSTTFATPIPDHYDWFYNNTLDVITPRADLPVLRIMPLGASITEGQTSTFTNGYRKPLRDQLRYLGYQVNMVGTLAAGNFVDNQHEGHEGAIVADFLQDGGTGRYKDSVTTALAAQPNVVLVLLGSNDCVQAARAQNTGFASTIGAQMTTLLDWIYKNDAGVTVILAALPPNKGDDPPNLNAYTNMLNAEYRRLVTVYAASGYRIGLADMNTGWFQTPQDLNDALHPNDGG
jgi:lysophospholipase L1-like esterase